VTNILAIDTSTPACSVAIQYGDEVLTKHKLASREHTKLLLPMVDDLLVESGIGLSQIDVIAFTAGPGSFTGIRIGFGVVQGLAFGADIPVLPVSSLETLSYTAVRKLGLADKCKVEGTGAGEAVSTEGAVQIIPMLDARMDEIYWSQFQLFHEPKQSQESKQSNVAEIRLERLCEDHLSAPEAIASIIQDSSVKGSSTQNFSSTMVVGDGWNYGDRISLTATTTDMTLLPEAQDILTIAVPLIGTESVISVDEASPVYLRDKITWKKRERLR